MDPVTIFGVAGFAGAMLSGFVGYLGRSETEGVSAKKLIQDLIAGTIVGLVAVSAGMAAIGGDANWMASLIMGILTGYGVNSFRVDAGLKK